MICVAIALVTAAIVMLMDNSKIVGKVDQIKVNSKNRFSKDNFAGYNLKLLPMAIIAAMPILFMNAHNTYFALYGEELGMDYLAAQTAGSAINGVSTWIVGILSDIINPSILVIIGLAGQALAPFLYAFPTTSAVLSSGVFLFAVTRYYSQEIRIAGMKWIARGDQGGFMASVLALNDVFSIFGTTIIGFIASGMSYKTMWIVIGIWDAIALVWWLFLEKGLIKQLKEDKENSTEENAA